MLIHCTSHGIRYFHLQYMLITLRFKNQLEWVHSEHCMARIHNFHQTHKSSRYTPITRMQCHGGYTCNPTFLSFDGHSNTTLIRHNNARRNISMPHISQENWKSGPSEGLLPYPPQRTVRVFYASRGSVLIRSHIALGLIPINYGGWIHHPRLLHTFHGLKRYLDQACRPQSQYHTQSTAH